MAAYSVRTNVAKPPKKKNTKPAPQSGPPKATVEKGTTPEFKIERGTTSYKPKDVRTGHPEYGKESATNPTPQFVKRAQQARVESVLGKGKPEGEPGLTYAAGVRTTTPDKFSMTSAPPRLHFTTPKPELKAKTSIRVKPGKLKPMDATYGTDSPSKGGGSRYVKRVRAK